MSSRSAVALLLVLAAGTASGAERLPVSPEAAARLGKARTLAVVVSVVMLEKGISGQPPVRRPEWEASARDALARTFASALQGRGLTVRIVGIPAGKEDEVGDVVAILHAVRACSGWYREEAHDSPPLRRPCTPAPPGRRTTPGVGSLAGLASDVGADAIALLTAVGTNSTTALSVLGWLAPGGDPVSTDSLALAILAPTGSVDWLSWDSSPTSDLRDGASAAAFVPALLEGIPLPAPAEARP